MAQLHIYPSAELPLHIKYQILSFIRIEWHELFRGRYRLADFTDKPTDPRNIVIVEEDVLISHAEITRRPVEYEDETYQLYGVSAVFTYPAFRGEGYGRRIIEIATEYLQDSDADIAMLFCQPTLARFYQRVGWRAMHHTRILYGDPAEPQHEPLLPMMLFLSTRGARLQNRLPYQDFYVGQYTW